ncbi:MAG: GatB/YqeY domain-containing protein [Acetobacteraceae bacterium]
MTLRERFSDELKTAMRARDAPRVSTLRMILARLKDIDIAARPKGVDAVPDADVLAMLRGMVKSRRESVDLYRQGNRPDLVAKEEAEITVIDAFLPSQMDAAAMAAAVAEAVAETGASGPRDMGKVMAALKARHGAALDLSRAGPLVKARLGS